MSSDSLLVIGIEVALLVALSAVASGLNIAVMSLDMSDLKRKAKLGNPMAQRVLPLRINTHLTLASILLSNVAAVSACSLVLDRRLNGWIAGGLSTLLIVILGEVLPQAMFAKNPLAWSSRFAPVLFYMRVITYPISKPLQFMLDRLFPQQHPKLQSRSELGLLINEHLSDDSSEMDDDELSIMRGALALSEKRVRDIMTPIRQTYWLTPDQILTDVVIDKLKSNGFSRVPVFDKSLTRCYGILLMKQMVDIDFDEREYKVGEMVLRQVEPIGSMTALDTMFRKFISAGTHLIPVERDDKIVGIVTIEDLFEEILGQEIEDETD